jgi:hypothetical protein
MSRANDISINDKNILIPVIPDVAWPITEEMVDTTSTEFLITFFIIRAYYDASQFEGHPQLVIDSGKVSQETGQPYQSLIKFAYSGETRYFKGQRILSEGVDRFGNVITSTPFGEDPTINITAIEACGGAGGL